MKANRCLILIAIILILSHNEGVYYKVKWLLFGFTIFLIIAYFIEINRESKS